jgi:hypothetical protein
MVSKATPNLGFNYKWDSGEDNWNIGMDANFAKLDSMIQITALAVVNSPTILTEGTIYLVSNTPTGAFAGKANNLAYKGGVDWEFIPPREGLTVYVLSDSSNYRFVSSWERVTAQVPSPAYRLLSRMRAGIDDVCIIANSDSTGITSDTDGTTKFNKWLYKIALYLGAQYPTYTIRYYDVVPGFYNPSVDLTTGNSKVASAVVSNGGSAYVVGEVITLAYGITLTVTGVSGSAVTTVSISSAGSVPSGQTLPGTIPALSSSGVGTGASFNVTSTLGPILYFYNAAFAGTQPTYLMGARFQTVFNPRKADLLIFNHGHNVDALAAPNLQQGMFMANIYSILKLHPNAGVLMNDQNPLRDTDVGNLRSSGARQTAINCGFGLLDSYQVFQRAGKPKEWYMLKDVANSVYDTIHPGIIGDQKMFEEVKKFFTWPVQPLLRRTGLEAGTNLLTNPEFASWTGSAPDGWTVSNVTPSKNTTQFESGTYSMQLATTGNAFSSISQSLPAALVKKLAGSVVTLSARVYVPEGNTRSSAASISVSEVDGTRTYGIPTGGRDGFIWKATIIEVPVNATALTILLIADIAGGASGNVCSFDRVCLTPGNMIQDTF